MNYQTYISSLAWILKKKEVFAIQGKYCQRCGENRFKFLNVHHIHYKTLGNEDPKRDLCVLCRKCHAEYHSIFGNDPDEFSFKNFVTWKPLTKIKTVVKIRYGKRPKPISDPAAKARKKEASVLLQIERLRIREERAKKFFESRK